MFFKNHVPCTPFILATCDFFFLTKGAMICCYTLFILLDRIQNYLGSISLSVPVRVFPDEGKLILNMSITTPWAGGPDFIKRAKEENTINTNAPPTPACSS